MICVISHDATYGNGAGLAAALSKRFNVRCIFFERDPKSMYKQFPGCEITQTIPSADEYIIVGCHTLRILKDKCNGKKAKIILTDSTYRKSYPYYNRLIVRNHWEPWAMPDLQHLCPKSKIYYQPFNINLPVDKYDKLTVCHSPFAKIKEEFKGTGVITSVVKKFNVDFKLIEGQSWRDTLEIKRRCHICIDQLYDGIGKSGLEALLLKCLVLTGEKPEANNLPPVAWITEDTLKNRLGYLIEHTYERNVIIEQQYKWAQENITYDAVSRRLYP